MVSLLHAGVLPNSLKNNQEKKYNSNVTYISYTGGYYPIRESLEIISGGGGGGGGGGVGLACDSMPSMVGESGGMLPQKILKIRCSEVHFGTLSSKIEQRKVVKKLIF